MRAQLYPAHVKTILNTLGEIRLCKEITLHHFQRFVGLMAAASMVIAMGLLHQILFQLWLKAREFHPRADPQRQIKFMCRGNL